MRVEDCERMAAPVCRRAHAVEDEREIAFGGMGGIELMAGRINGNKRRVTFLKFREQWKEPVRVL